MKLSGLSLFVHLAIVGIATLWRLVTGKRGTSIEKSVYRSNATEANVVARRVASSAILATVLTVMVMLTSATISLGIERGADEPQIEFIRNTYTDIREEIAEADINLLDMTRTFTITVNEAIADENN